MSIANVRLVCSKEDLGNVCCWGTCLGFGLRDPSEGPSESIGRMPSTELERGPPLPLCTDGVPILSNSNSIRVSRCVIGLKGGPLLCLAKPHKEDALKERELVTVTVFCFRIFNGNSS